MKKTRERNKPTESWIERAKNELANEKEPTIARAYELGRIRGYKDAIKVAKEWLEKKAQFAKAQYCDCVDEDDDYYNGKADGLAEALAYFETDMNKLWEEQK